MAVKTHAEIMEAIALQMDDEAEKLRVFRDAARRRGEADVAQGFGDKAAGFAKAAELIRAHGGQAADREIVAQEIFAADSTDSDWKWQRRFDGAHGDKERYLRLADAAIKALSVRPENR